VATPYALAENSSQRVLVHVKGPSSSPESRSLTRLCNDIETT
jgi:hypothetical protein